MAMFSAKESGHYGDLISLGGIKGLPGMGRIGNFGLLGVPNAGIQILSDNPKRISAMLENYGTEPIDIEFGATGSGSMQLQPGDILQIDKDFPWTGQVFGYSSTVTLTYIRINEVSVQ